VFSIDARGSRSLAGGGFSWITVAIVNIFPKFSGMPARSRFRLRFLSIVLAAAIVPTALAMRGPTAAPQVVSPGRFAPATAAQPPERSVVGTLDNVDTKAMQIVVGSATGKQTLHLQTGVTIRQGAKTVKVSELPAHKGERVKVRYREADGVRQAEWIVLASVTAPQKPKRSDKP
jgi:hypothetical protein